MNTPEFNNMSFDQKLRRYAEASVTVGVNLRKGQQLLIMADISAYPLVRHITDVAYERGASLVTPIYRDEIGTLSRATKTQEVSYFDQAADWLYDGIKNGLIDNDMCRIAIHTGDTQILKDCDPGVLSRMNKATATAVRPFMEMVSQSKFNWNIVAYVTPEWARQVFPDNTLTDAEHMLWEAVFKASRVVSDGWRGNWEQHNADLRHRANSMNDRRYDALHFKGPGTDLVVGLADQHNWSGGSTVSENGIRYNANIPTEEIFTTPHMYRVNGTVSSTKPLFYNGSVIEGIKVTFKDGEIVESHADVGNDLLTALLNTDEGSRRIGEVALVPYSSPISKSGILFKSTLFDENASCHIALGRSYPKCILPAAAKGKNREELKELGANDSVIHVDWMIGSDQIDIDGIKGDQRDPIFRNGEWVI